MAGRGWEELFLKALAETGNVSAAAKLAGVARQTAYEAKELRPEFAARWDDALEEACDALELEARRRAKDGAEKPVFYLGREVSRVREYSDVLLIFLLKAHRPEKYRELKLPPLEALLAALPAEVSRAVRKAIDETVPAQ